MSKEKKKVKMENGQKKETDEKQKKTVDDIDEAYIDVMSFRGCTNFSFMHGAEKIHGKIKVVTREIAALVEMSLKPDDDGDYMYKLLMKNGKELDVFHHYKLEDLTTWIFDFHGFEEEERKKEQENKRKREEEERKKEEEEDAEEDKNAEKNAKLNEEEERKEEEKENKAEE